MKKGLIFLALVVIVLGVLGFQTGAYYAFERLFTGTRVASHDSGGHTGTGSNGNNSSTTKPGYIETNTIINYGNSTSIWFNGTSVPDSWNFYNLTKFLTNGRVHVAPVLYADEHQVLGINGVEQNSTFYWSLWKFCPSQSGWDWSPVGVDNILLSNGGIYGWYFQNQNTEFPPVPGAKTVVVLDIRNC